MSLRTAPWPAGMPCWADLSTPDPDAAKTFYTDVLGWTYQATGEEYGGYVIGTVDGVAAAGIGPLQPGAPIAWTLYFASDDADKTAAAVAENGGTVLMPPGDVGPMGRMFLAADPTGAAFGVWQAGVHIGAGIVNQPGGLAWEDLRSPAPDTARPFYSAVFGLQTQPLPEAGPDYHTFALADQIPIGGMGGPMGSADTPAHWLVYFAVADADAAVAAAEKAGGTVLVPVFDTPYGRMAGLLDPAGAVFWIAQNTGQPQPDRSN